MRRIISLLFFAALFLVACTPTVTLLDVRTEPSPTDGPTLLPPPLARTPVPTPTLAPNLGITPQDLQGVQVLIWHGWDGSFSSLFEQMASEFNLSNKWGIKVSITPQHNLNLLVTAMAGSLGKPEQPDIVVALPEQILAWQSQVVDLTPYVTQPDIGMDTSDLPPAFGDQSNLDAVRYGFPAARTARFLFYNLGFAHDLGFQAAPQSAEEFRKQACAANAFWKKDSDLTNDGFGGLALDVTSNWQTPYSWLSAGGGQVFSAGELHFNTAENISALDFVSKLRADNCAWLPDAASNFDSLATRHALFITGSLDDISGQNAAFSAATSSDQWTVLPFPGQNAGIVAYGSDYAVLKSDKSRQLAAWLFIRWMLEPQNQVRWSRGTGMFPVTNTAIKMLKADGTLPPQWLAALDLIPMARTYPQTAGWRLADKLLADGFVAFNNGYPNLTLAGVLDVMDTTIKDMTKK